MAVPKATWRAEASRDRAVECHWLQLTSVATRIRATVAQIQANFCSIAQSKSMCFASVSSYTPSSSGSAALLVP